MSSFDWSAIAKARGLNLSASELERIAPALDTLEEACRTLLKDLTPDLEPAVEFSAEADAEGHE